MNNELISTWNQRLRTIDAMALNTSHDAYPAAKQLLLVSDYAKKHVSIFKFWLEATLPTFNDLLTSLEQCPLNIPEADFLKAIRLCRHSIALRLMLGEIMGEFDTQSVMTNWSSFADCVIQKALAYGTYHLTLRYGTPCNQQGEPVVLYPIAMGKLGGNELNFSSDIDVIFAFSEASEALTPGPSPTRVRGEYSGIDNALFYTKLIQQFMHYLQSKTADGFVFRVDLRLRPYGEGGPLVATLDYLESYYQEQGRDWERYAMVKARVIGVDDAPVMRFIRPFVYRRYLDFGVIESLRSLKGMIAREVELNPNLDDIKRGLGGIREIEFILQTIQIIRAGRNPSLQVTSAVLSFERLKHEKLLDKADALKQAYLFLRQLENALQMQADTQTHTLPKDRFVLYQIAQWLGFETTDMMLTKLAQYQRIVRHCFLEVLGQSHDYEDANKRLLHQLLQLWQGNMESSMAETLLASLNFEAPARCYALLASFRQSVKYRRATQSARLRLESLMMQLLFALQGIKATDEVLLALLRLLEHLIGRSAYYALLTENNQVLQAVIECFSKSQAMQTLLVEHPFLLEVFLKQAQIRLPSKKQLAETLQHLLVDVKDGESQMLILRQFKLMNETESLYMAIKGEISATRLGQFLSDVAEVIVQAVLTLAVLQLSRNRAPASTPRGLSAGSCDSAHMDPADKPRDVEGGTRYPGMESVLGHIGIIAYGKLGSRELSLDSDLDLVFIHEVTHAKEPWVTRIIQKILHMLTTRTEQGILYHVDTRLRPSGASGLLISHVDAYDEYQCHQAWVWEHQALLKARILTGRPALKAQFYGIKHAVITTKRDAVSLKTEIRDMRLKMQQNLDKASIKHVAGGLIDIEFLLQYWLLDNHVIAAVKQTHPALLLKQLYLEHYLSEADYQSLIKAYRAYQKQRHFPDKKHALSVHQESVKQLYAQSI